MPPKKHSIQSDGDTASPKLARIDTDGENGFSSSGKKRSAASQRTGQACDRCKARKIRCDDTEGGCLPCRQNNTECKTTDRITHRATVRGHTEALERETASLRQHVYDLEVQLRELGVEPRPSSQYISARPSASAWSGSGGLSHLYAQSQSHLQNGFDNGGQPAQEANMFANGPMWREQQPGGDPHLGVSPSNDLLSPVKGTSLSVFGFQVDIAHYVHEGVDKEDESPTSYKSLLKSTLKITQTHIDLPASFQECHEYAQWFLAGINPWAPMLHRPTFMALIQRIYYENYTPTTAESVMVHVMLANIKYQLAKRNADDANIQSPMLDESYKHHHFALSKMYELRTNRDIDDIRAITMIVVHLRNFPKPAPAYLFTSWAFTMCIEMGLHRSETSWQGDSPKKSKLEIEMRKRVFWLLLTMHVFLSGKMGRPMPIRIEDIDIEYPELLNDDLEPAPIGDEPQHCQYGGMVSCFKLVPLFMEVYNTIYALRPQPNYEDTIRRLELKIEKWRREIPTEVAEARLDVNGPSRHSNQIFGLYLQAWENELQLLLHHPRLCRSSSPEVWNRNLNFCWDAAKNIIDINRQLADKLSLDSTWYSATVFIAAIFTLLFISWERRGQLTAESLGVLRADMKISYSLLLKLGILLGTGPKLCEAMEGIIEQCVTRLQRYQLEQTASAGIKQSPAPSPARRSSQALKAEPSQQQQQQQPTSNRNPYPASSEATEDPDGAHPQQTPSRGYQQHRHHQDPSASNFPQAHHSAPIADPSLHAQTQQQPAPNPYPTTMMPPTAAYPPPQHVNPGQPEDSPGGLPAGYPYNAYQAMSSDGPNGYSVDHLNHQASMQNGNGFPPMYGHQQSGPDPGGYGGPQQWRQWVGAAKEGLQPHEYMHSAQTLIALQSGRGELAGTPQSDPVAAVHAQVDSAQQRQQHQMQREHQQQQQAAAHAQAHTVSQTMGGGTGPGSPYGMTSTLGQWPMTAYNIGQFRGQ